MAATTTSTNDHHRLMLIVLVPLRHVTTLEIFYIQAS